MAREEWGGAGAKEGAGKEQGAAGERSQGKTVRFVTRDAICDNRVKRVEATGVNMVQSLVPHLPGLDKDKVYVISGPFPNYDPVSGPSQLLTATPVSAGATVIAVPSGPPPPAPAPPQTPAPGPGQTQQTGQQAAAGSCGGVAVGGAVMPHPHMLHWDAAHPGGQMVPLRQPTLPVYYNTGPGQHMPGSGSGTSSGLESPASEDSSGQETAGSSCMSESSSTSGDTGPEPEHCSVHHRHPQHGMGAGYKQSYWPQVYPMVPPHLHMMSPHQHHHPLKHVQAPPQYCHLPGLAPGITQLPLHPHFGPGHNFNQMYISQ